MTDYDKICARLTDIVNTYPNETRLILSRLDIDNMPSAPTLIIAYASYPDELIKGLMEIRNNSSFDGISPVPKWFKHRQKARLGNYLNTTKQYGGLQRLGPYELPMSFNASVDGEFRAGPYFKKPLKFNPHRKGKVSSDPIISEPTPFKEAEANGVKSAQLVKKPSPRPNPIPEDEKFLRQMFDTAVTHLLNHGNATLEKILSDRDMEDRGEVSEVCLPLTDEKIKATFSMGRVNLIIAAMVAAGIVLLFMATRSTQA